MSALTGVRPAPRQWKEQRVPYFWLAPPRRTFTWPARPQEPWFESRPGSQMQQRPVFGGGPLLFRAPVASSAPVRPCGSAFDPLRDRCPQSGEAVLKHAGTSGSLAALNELGTAGPLMVGKKRKGRRRKLIVVTTERQSAPLLELIDPFWGGSHVLSSAGTDRHRRSIASSFPYPLRWKRRRGHKQSSRFVHAARGFVHAANRLVHATNRFFHATNRVVDTSDWPNLANRPSPSGRREP